MTPLSHSKVVWAVPARGYEAVTLCCFPAFLKVRWRDGKGPDAKAYLLASVS